MRPRDIRLLVLIAVLTAISVWVALPTNPGIHLTIGKNTIDRDIKISQGLDLQGGMEVLLEADLPANQTIDADSMAAAKGIVESRVNGLGVTEPIVQSVGSRRILVGLPGIQDPEAAISTLRQTGLMEWVDTGSTYLEPGTKIKTDIATSTEASSEVTPTETIYKTLLTGRDLKTASVAFDQQTGAPEIAFELNADGAKAFAEHTANNINKYLAIALDKVIISCPRINSAIPDGQGRITGQFTADEAKSTVLQLRYGSLPVPLKVIDTRAVGPTLGQDSVQKSVRAGTIGLIVVLLFMLVYYRLPGLLADVALIIYALLTLSLFKLIPVTLTLPGIAGFLLSVGMAVDANILIFERMREELRQGRTLQRAIESGFRRAWTTIWESNTSTWITCAILFIFGNSFGASVVKGFAVTLALGVAINMFTAVTVTRTFVHVAFAVGGEKLRDHKWLLGV